MTTEAALAHLTAGLAEDERCARAALVGTESARWVAAGDEVYAVAGSLADPRRCDEHAAGRPNHCYDQLVATAVDVRDVNADQRAAHIARFGPRRVLDFTEALQKVLDILQRRDALFQDRRFHRDVESHYFEQGFDAACGLLIEALAKGYTEDAAETGALPPNPIFPSEDTDETETPVTADQAPSTCDRCYAAWLNGGDFSPDCVSGCRQAYLAWRDGETVQPTDETEKP